MFIGSTICCLELRWFLNASNVREISKVQINCFRAEQGKERSHVISNSLECLEAKLGAVKGERICLQSITSVVIAVGVELRWCVEAGAACG